MGKKIFAEISKKYFGVGPVLVQGGPDLVQGGPLLVQGGPLLVQPKVSSTEKFKAKGTEFDLLPFLVLLCSRMT